MLISILILMITTIVMFLASILSKKALNDREKSSPLNADLTPNHHLDYHFLYDFFFWFWCSIFDVEMALILPMIIILKYFNILIWKITSITFIFNLLIGLYHKWNHGMLNWSN